MHHNIPPLIIKKMQHVLAPDEEAVLEAWAASNPVNRALLERLLDPNQVLVDIKDFEELWGGEVNVVRYDRMEHAVLTNIKPHVKRRWLKWFPYTAAAAILLMVAGVWLFFDSTTVAPQSTIAYADKISPGGNRANLTLADGRTIDLSEVQTGIIVSEDVITYSDGASLAAISLERAHSPLVLATPRGGTYQVTLSDGTKVWLNSESILKYPTHFGESERVVELIGEAYFEVAKSKDPKKQHWPFRVLNTGQRVEVLGTQFNISAYPDEPEVKTTLVEGSVRVMPTINHQSPIILAPGQQSIADGKQVVVNDVDVAQYTTWKDGFFHFNGDSPQEAFAQLSRWYDIEVVYRGEIPAVQFYGKMERNKPLGALLKILDRAGLEFEIVPKKEAFQLIIGHD